MQILFMIPRLTYSGAPKILAWVASQMADRGYKVSIVTFFSDEQAQILDKRVTFYSLNMQQSHNRLIRNSIGMLITLNRLHQKINSLNPDITVSFLDSVGYLYLLKNHFSSKRKIVISERADPYSYSGVIAKIRFFLMTYADGIVFQTIGAKEFFHGSIHENSVVIPNPVTVKKSIQQKLDRYRVPYKNRDCRIVSVGRLSIHQKRQDIMLQAFEKVHLIHPEIKLVLYGDGPDLKKIQEMIKDMNLGNSVTLAGRIDNIEDSIYCARAFVLTSDFEGIPNSLIEAMLLGIPSVATDCSPGGAALLVKNGKNAYLVPCGDVDEIAVKLTKLIENESISDYFSQESPKIQEIFSENKIADMWEKYFIYIYNKRK